MEEKAAPGRGPLASWLPSLSAAGHFDVLDGLRGIAILLVVCRHALYFNPQGGWLQRALGSIASAGFIGVPVFFVLSGCVISYPFWKRRRGSAGASLPAGYARRRFWKIAPPYWLSIGLFSLFYLYAPPVENVWPSETVGRQALAWAVGVPEAAPPPVYFNPGYWSLTVEVGFYLLLPCLIPLTRRLSYRAAAGSLFLFLFLLAATARHLFWLDPAAWPPLPAMGFSPGLFPPVSAPGWLHPLFRFARYADCFGWGILFAAFLAARPPGSSVRVPRFLGNAGLAGLAAVLVVIGLWSLRDADGGRLLPTHLHAELLAQLPNLAAFLLLFYVYHPKGAAGTVLGSPLLRWVGIVSYEWYLFNQPILSWAQSYLGSAHGSPASYLLHIAPAVAVSLLAAAAVYRFFSLPLLRWTRG